MNIDIYKSKTSRNKNNNNYIKNLITRILLSIIFILIIGIYIKMSANNLTNVKKYLFEDSIKFTKINNWYQKNLGTLIPEVNNNTSLVFNNDDLVKNKKENYYDGLKIFVEKNSPISTLSGGIVIFIGEKENYGHTIIIQGNDGNDYWYGEINNSNVNLYDYIETNTLIGESKNDYFYLVIEKDGIPINYDKYY